MAHVIANETIVVITDGSLGPGRIATLTFTNVIGVNFLTPIGRKTLVITHGTPPRETTFDFDDIDDIVVDLGATALTFTINYNVT